MCFQSAPFKIPRLRKGTIPSQFPWTETTENFENLDQDQVANQCQTENVEETYDDTNDNDLATLSFDDVIKILNRKELHMPNRWTYSQFVTDGIRLLIFFLPTCNKIDNYINRYTLNSLKDIVLQENMTLQINILNQPIISMPSNMQIPVIENIKQLQELLFSLDNVDICIGANDVTRDIENLDYNLAYKGICNTWRHKKCLLILPDSSKNICKFCSIMKKSLTRKRLRKKSNSIERIRIILPNAEKRRKLLALQYKYHKTEKARKIRACY